EARQVRPEPRHCITYFGRKTKPSEGSALTKSLSDFSYSRSMAQEVRVDRTGAYRIDSNALRTQCVSHGLRHQHDATLARRIRYGHARADDAPHPPCHYDASRFLSRAHLGSGSLC